MNNTEAKIKEVYSSFGERLSYDDFKNKLDSLPVDKWNFVRAVLLYQQSVKCSKCNPNVGMSLLCSCADAIQLVGEGKPKENFMKFYLNYCPLSLRTSPIKYFPEGKLLPSPLTAPFEKALHYIYKQFRCLFVHEGIGRLDIAPEIEGVIMIPFPLMDKIKKEKDVYLIDLDKILSWFDRVTIESLSTMLLQAGKT